ncbi:NAD(P)-binding protein [Tothia fuscella]|uniref:NAD(P)-binding protein n=1 Tax=Tothia fuscella TaxID=1048955 RepID=A0A9P4NGB0_9PEZI|nr:NAD(P)-binding protein [Tothia fuscella]
MVVVAIPGGTSLGLGRSIVKALLNSGEHTPIVLSRKSSQIPQWLLELGVEVRKVEYSDVETLAEGLKGVHTVICTLLPKDGTFLPSQLNILTAGLRVGISRFAPAEFGCGPKASLQIGMLAAQTPIWDACREAKAQHEGFEWAGFHCGLFMNYLGYGCAKEEEALAGKSRDGEWLFHVKDLKAIIPVEEKDERLVPRITMTELGDVGAFVAAACSLSPGSWKEDFSMVGETLGMDEIVGIIEKVRGKKVDVTYRSLEETGRELVKVRGEGEVMRVFWLELEMCTAKDKVGMCVLESVLNGLCPGVRPTRVEEYVRRYWGG